MRAASETAFPSQSVGDDPVLVQWVEAVKARLESGECASRADGALSCDQRVIARISGLSPRRPSG